MLTRFVMVFVSWVQRWFDVAIGFQSLIEHADLVLILAKVVQGLVLAQICLVELALQSENLLGTALTYLIELSDLIFPRFAHFFLQGVLGDGLFLCLLDFFVEQLLALLLVM